MKGIRSTIWLSDGLAGGYFTSRHGDQKKQIQLFSGLCLRSVEKLTIGGLLVGVVRSHCLVVKKAEQGFVFSDKHDTHVVILQWIIILSFSSFGTVCEYNC